MASRQELRERAGQPKRDEAALRRMMRNRLSRGLFSGRLDALTPAGRLTRQAKKAEEHAERLLRGFDRLSVSTQIHMLWETLAERMRPIDSDTALTLYALSNDPRNVEKQYEDYIGGLTSPDPQSFATRVLTAAQAVGLVINDTEKTITVPLTDPFTRAEPFDTTHATETAIRKFFAVFVENQRFAQQPLSKIFKNPHALHRLSIDAEPDFQVTFKITHANEKDTPRGYHAIPYAAMTIAPIPISNFYPAGL